MGKTNTPAPRNTDKTIAHGKPHRSTLAINSLLDTLATTAQQMRTTSEMMIRLKQYPNFYRHGLELRGASEMVSEWIDGIKKDLTTTARLQDRYK